MKDLVPTWSHVARTQIEGIKKVTVPIACIRHENKYYILDGHARSLRAKELGLDSIDAMILLSTAKIDFGIVRTAEVMNLRQLEDVKIME